MKRTTVNLDAVVDRIVRDNPCKPTRPEIKYPHMIKSFLYAAYCGMTASTLWDGTSQVNGEFISVEKNGGNLAHYALDSEKFKAHLFNNCYLEFPSAKEDYGDYARVYGQDGEFYFNLYFQIRYQ